MMPRIARLILISSLRFVCILSVLVAASGLFVRHAAAQSSAPAGPWVLLDRMPPGEILTEPWLRPVKGQALALDLGAFGQVLAQAPIEDTPQGLTNPLVVALPDPDGHWQRFRIVSYSCMEAPLAASHPELRTYRGEGVDDPYASIRITHTPMGLMAHVRTISATERGGAWYIAPYTRSNTQLHTSFYRADEVKPDAPRDFTCETVDVDPVLVGFAPRATVGPTRRQYRLAIATTGEFTANVGGTIAALTRVTDAVNQMNGIYETEFAVRFVLVANESAVIYPSSSSDPFNSPNSTNTSNNNLQTALDNTIGSANYDIGHMFHFGISNSGLAGGIGTVCSSSTKGKGYTRHSNIASTFFVSDYVAHEIGHQCGGRHPHNNCSGSGGDSDQYLVEPGSGSTIMGYAGICGTQNLQSNSDPYFNGLNINQIVTYLSGASCTTTASTFNNAPTIAALTAYSIPAKTPFTLTASASDPNGDAITYCWEQQDAGSTVTYPPSLGTDNGTCPLLRSRPATASPSRTIPPLANILANSINVQEMLPQVARSMDWRVTVRDNRSGGGGVTQATVAIAVQSTGPFQVTAPGAGTFSGPMTVTWLLGGSNASPIGCASVKISLSTDGGNTFPTVLLASTPNTGAASVTLPDIATSSARIKVEAIGNIFFDISHANFSITPSVPAVSLASDGGPVVLDVFPNGNSNARPDPGENFVVLVIRLRNSGTTTATGVGATLTSLTPTVSIVSGMDASTYFSIGPSLAAENSSPFAISVAPGHPCGAPINLSLAVTYAQGWATIPMSLSTGVPTVPPSAEFVYSGSPVAIPDGDNSGINLNLAVSGVGTIGDLNFKFGAAGGCSASIGSTTVGLDHSYVGDLIVRLTSPSGTTVVLMDRPGTGNGGSTGSIGNNFCNTVLDDDVGTPLIQNIALDGSGSPYTGSYVPANPLSIFDGQNADGVWTLNVSDNLSNDMGRVRAFSLIITPAITYVCTPPNTPTVACCAASGSCSLLSATGCASAGAYQGDGAACSPNPCPQPIGACCAMDGTCASLSIAACAAATGTYLGDATPCSPNPCPQPMGACCTPAGTCTQLTAAQCTGADVYQGNGSTCSPTLCPPQIVTISVSIGGSGHGTVSSTPEGIDCPALCAAPLIFGTTIVLTPHSTADSVFAGWSGGPCSGTAPCLFAAVADTSVMAIFRCKADFNGVGGTSIADIFAFVTAWFAGSPAADFDGLNGINVGDVFAFLTAWFVGC